MSDPKEERLRQLPLFKDADRKAIENLASLADEASVSAGQALITEGHQHREVYVIESGTASVIIDGNEVAEIPAGEMVGEVGFFSGQPASATVSAKTDMRVLVIPYNGFDRTMEENPAMVRAVLKELAERLYATDAKLQ
ncbi:MAG: cyclic nucleotide-binding domain-containing protein [Actinomycetota bacterium]